VEVEFIQISNSWPSSIRCVGHSCFHCSKSAFSTGSQVLDPFQSSLSPKTIEALICAQVKIFTFTN
jgi:hypothetical protein